MLRSEDGIIGGCFLLDKNGDWRFYITSGKHRAYVLAALGYEKIPVRLNTGNELVKQIDSDKWFHVKKGNYSSEQAQKVFERFFTNI